VKRRLVLLFALLPVFILGCSTKNPNVPASLHGKVTYNGKPVTGGTLTIIAPNNGGRFSCVIDKDGIYGAADLPAGECVVTIDTEGLKAQKQAGRAGYTYGVETGHKMNPNDYREKMIAMGKVPSEAAAPKVLGEYVKIPSRYSNPLQTPLRVTLSKGDMKQDFELTD
jgi:hypothetical protein